MSTQKPPAEMTQTMARALCEAGYMTVREYIALCDKNGWKPQ